MGKSDCQHENTSFKLDGGVYFLTITIMGWKHVFIKREYLDFIIDSLKFFQDKRDVKTVGYCLMPNHLHWIFKLSSSYSDLVKDPVEYPYSSCRFYENSSDWNGLHIQSLF